LQEELQKKEENCGLNILIAAELIVTSYEKKLLKTKSLIFPFFSVGYKYFSASDEVEL